MLDRQLTKLSNHLLTMDRDTRRVYLGTFYELAKAMREKAIKLDCSRMFLGHPDWRLAIVLARFQWQGIITVEEDTEGNGDLVIRRIEPDRFLKRYTRH